MLIAIGSDHRGFSVKQHIVGLLVRQGHEVADIGAASAESVDYPDIAVSVARLVTSAQAERGILICGTGLGMAIAANKYDGIRATPVHDEVTAELSRRHTDGNILCLSADLLGERLIDNILEIWLTTPFDGGRHARRVEKIRQIEQARAKDCK